MKRYAKNPAAGDVYLPGIGKLQEGQILTGEGYAQLAPKFLLEVPETPAFVPLESTEPSRGPGQLTEPAPTPGQRVVESPVSPSTLPPRLDEDGEGQAEDTVKRGRGRPRKG